MTRRTFLYTSKLSKAAINIATWERSKIDVRWLIMDGSVYDTYLEEALKADEKAEHIPDEATAAMWRRIAESYRELAADQEAPHLNWI